MVTDTLLVHHAANRGYHYPPNSLRGLRHCLESGARAVEVDINPLAGGDFALLHDGNLEKATNGRGLVSAATADQVGHLRYVWQGAVTDEAVALLSQAITLIGDYPHLQELQLDFKVGAWPTDAVLHDLLQQIEPAKGRIRVTSVADWAVRRLRAMDTELLLGFDPLLYLDVDTGDEEEAPPFRVGMYGYWDDHPLGLHRWGPSADYLAARAEALWAQTPANAAYYIRASLLARALDDGFDWIAFLHGRGAQVDAWTLNAERPDHVALARRLVAAQVDRITTNDAPHLALALGSPASF